MSDSKFIYETKSTDDVITAYSKNFGKNSLSLLFGRVGGAHNNLDKSWILLAVVTFQNSIFCEISIKIPGVIH